ncbi:hypothetical protein RGCCGE502_17015 [Rhizobium grahamii CCGE 502]|uniref:Uncharacterized protein n=1 Tax=Rhizobium grahamii CCGE 502 TaxID=990285 RepID=S3HGA3_9HYPH|nr:hypothetical protein RGCCGE502_17015 [Rhizobium grahamii CCGE 502]
MMLGFANGIHPRLCSGSSGISPSATRQIHADWSDRAITISRSDASNASSADGLHDIKRDPLRLHLRQSRIGERLIARKIKTQTRY